MLGLPVHHTCLNGQLRSPLAIRNPLPLGQWTAKLLGMICITPERIERITRKTCYCRRRERQLDDAGLAISRYTGLSWLLGIQKD